MSLLDLAGLASEQWGLVTTAQAGGVGASTQTMARWANEGALTRLSHGVYKVAGSSYDPRDELRAAWLALDPGRLAAERLVSEPIDAVVSHSSAARVHRLGDMSADRHQFIVQGRKQTRRADVQIRRRSGGIDPNSWRVVDGLPTTTVLTTIVDLATDHVDGGHLAGVVRDAIATSAVDLRELSTALRPFAHQYGGRLGDGDALIERFLDEAGIPQSMLDAADLLTSMSRAAFSDADLRELAEKLASSDVRKMLEALSKPSTQRNLAQLNETLEALRRAAG